MVNETLRRTAISRSPLLYSRVTSCAMSINRMLRLSADVLRIRDRRLLLVALVVLACSEGRTSNVPLDAAVSPESTQVVAASAAPSRVSADSASSQASKVTVLFFGTSLTAGYGLDPGLDFPTMIAKRSQATGSPIVAVNAGLSGETSAGAVRRIDWALRKPVDIVVVETGGNDALRALDPDSLEANVDAVVSRVKEVQPQARILLAVMESPPNLGKQYNARFREAYVKVAKSENVTLVPFLLDRVAGRAELNQADGVHPNEKGERIVADNVWKTLEPVVREVYSKRPNR
ncbi:MAG: arylesterase [Gemmatimonadaceae bacterium]